MFRNPTLFAITLVVGSGAPLVAQTSIAVHPALHQEIARSPAAERVSPRVDVAVGFANLNLQKLPADNLVGGSPLASSVSVGYFWTRYLATQVEVAFQIEDWNPDSAYETAYSPSGSGGYRVTVTQLKHNYKASRRTVAQIVQSGHDGFRPYVGVGVGIESQSIVTSRHQYTESLAPGASPPPGAKTVSELPTTLPGVMDTRRTVPFAQAGAKLFLGGRAYILADCKFRRSGSTLVRIGLGLELF